MNRMIFVLVFMLSGCTFQQIANDMTKNGFLESVPLAVGFGGIYSAAMGPYIITYKLASDGTGFGCYFQNGTAVVHRLKVFSRDGNAYGVILETGTISVIRLLSDGTYSLESYGEKFKLLPDNDLILSNLSCKEKFLRANI